MSEKDQIIKHAIKYCEAQGYRLTPPRMHVFTILVQADKPLGAYEVLEELGQYIDNPKPPTAYRAIDFWREHGFVHKIESLNAFVTCCTEHAHHDTQFLVCDGCQTVEELHAHSHKDTPPLPKGFVAKRSFTEIHGVCGDCHEKKS